MPLRQVVLDFDGTSTLVENIQREFLERYRELVAADWGDTAAAQWDENLAAVRAASPLAAWMLGGAPAAPAAADPYILSGEVVALTARRLGVRAPAQASSWYVTAYHENPAPLRAELGDLLVGLVGDGCAVAFVSNSDRKKVAERVGELRLPPGVAEKVQVHGNAAKFCIQELWFERHPPEPLAARFRALPAAAPSSLPRPVYLRRGAYFHALAGVWEKNGTTPEETLVVGDVWEMDLAMPAALGCRVAFLRRPEPYPPYDYELEAAAGASASIIDDLTTIREITREG
jgi:FMN phosphatase YigB (HAD superfamily)